MSENFDYALRGIELENPIRYENPTKLVDYSYYYFSFHAIPAVVFPEQSIPLMFRLGQEHLFEKFVAAADSNYFVVLIPKGIADCRRPPFIATVCKVVQTNPQNYGVELLGMHRCRVLERDNEKVEVRAQLLPEIELPPILPRILPKYASCSSWPDKYSLATRISGYPFELILDITKRNNEKCSAMMREIVGNDLVEAAISRGLTSFSFFVARQMFASRDIEYRILKENSADARVAAAAKYFQVAEAVCKNCHLELFKSEHILQEKDLNLTHVNEHGYVHQIALVSEVENFEEHSPPSFEYTWFPGFAWIILGCSRCDEHIGWMFVSRTTDRFFGVRRDAVTYRYRGEDESDQKIGGEA